MQSARAANSTTKQLSEVFLPALTTRKIVNLASEQEMLLKNAVAARKSDFHWSIINNSMRIRRSLQGVSNRSGKSIGHSTIWSQKVFCYPENV